MADPQPLPPTLIQKAADRLERLVDDIVLLRVTTIIGAAHVDAGSATDRQAETAITLDADKPQLVASTTINMLIGDFTQVIDPAFMEKPEYMKLHADAIVTARAIRAETMSLLKSIAKDIEQRL